ncbi:MAG: UPF0758 domain-containing protein [Sphingobacteriales bacterium]
MMEAIKNMPPMDRPREKLIMHGAKALTDQELIAILLGSGTPKVPLHQICNRIKLKDIGQMDMKALCRIKGIGQANAAILLAAAEFSRRLGSKAEILADEAACAAFLRPILEKADQLQYILLLLSETRELMAFAEAGSVLPDIAWLTELAIQAGASRILLGRNGWPAFSNAENRYLDDLHNVCAALNIICDGLMSVGPERFKMI